MTQHSETTGTGRPIPLFEGNHTLFPLAWFLRYEFLQRVGEGAYGSVWRCQDKVTGEIVACKKLKDVAQSEEVSCTVIWSTIMQSEPPANLDCQSKEACGSLECRPVYLSVRKPGGDVCLMLLRVCFQASLHSLSAFY